MGDYIEVRNIKLINCYFNEGVLFERGRGWNWHFLMATGSDYENLRRVIELAFRDLFKSIPSLTQLLFEKIYSFLHIRTICYQGLAFWNEGALMAVGGGGELSFLWKRNRKIRAGLGRRVSSVLYRDFEKWKFTKKFPRRCENTRDLISRFEYFAVVRTKTAAGEYLISEFINIDAARIWKNFARISISARKMKKLRRILLSVCSPSSSSQDWK